MQKYFLFTVCLLINVIAFAQKGAKYKTITIQPKQTLYGIAREYNVPASEIKKSNPQYAPDFKLKIGDKIKIPVSTATTPAKPTELKAEKAPEKKEESTSKTVEPKKDNVVANAPTIKTNAVATTSIHVVKKGETLTGIAKSNGMTLKDIRSLNGFSENVNVKIGQKIKVKSNEKAVAVKTEKTPANQIVYKPIQDKQDVIEVKEVKTERSTLGEVPAPKEESRPVSYEITPAPLPTTAVATAPTTTGKPITGELENTYNTAFNKNSKKTVRGLGFVAADNNIPNSSSALYNYAEVGDVIKVVNLMSKKVAYLKVVGKLTINDETGQNIIQILPETAKMMSANENRFLVEVTSY